MEPNENANPIIFTVGTDRNTTAGKDGKCEETLYSKLGRSSSTNLLKPGRKPQIVSSASKLAPPAPERTPRIVKEAGSSDSSGSDRTPPPSGRVRAMSGGRRERVRGGGVRLSPSLKSLGQGQAGNSLRPELRRANASWASFADGPGSGWPAPVLSSVASLASVGMGSTDGRKVTVRRVPTSPEELLNIAAPTVPLDEDLSSCTSVSGTLSECGTHFRPRRRDRWPRKLQFVLACVGYSVGLGSLWRFPYLCYKSGGGVFLVAYLLVLLVCGVPILYMELAIGQFTRRGPIGAFSQICPLFKGVGVSSVMVSFFMSTYYNVIIAYFLYYLFTALKAELPWGGCSNKWNSLQCWHSSLNTTRPNFSQPPSEEFYERKVLQMTSGIDQPGVFRLELAACLFLSWVLVYFALWKSVRSSGRVLYFTATLPFILVLVFLARSLTLDGAGLGLQYFFKPDWALLLQSKVWVNAMAQNFVSFGIAFGSVVSLASYNRYNNQILVDTVAVAVVNAITSLLVGLFAFATIGSIAQEHKTDVQNVISDGPGLVFVLYPKAMAHMPFPTAWAVLFFFMLLCLGLNSQFAIVEVVVTSLQDGFPTWIRRRLACHEILVLIVCLISFLLGLPNTLQGGIYVFQLMDHYVVTTTILYIALFEVIVVCWLFGTGCLCQMIHHMTNRMPSLYIRLCWLIASPLLILFVIVFSIVDYQPASYDNGSYRYPGWAQALGWTVASLSLLCIPVTALYVLTRMKGDSFKKRMVAAMQSRCAELEVSPALSSADVGSELKEVKSLMDHPHPHPPPQIEINSNSK